ncbi:uncharacterized protein LOC103707267 isoform X1 [Phoenix dactylifera]|uniref:Uncharacterized protein LOC103707267 isoform X1 n=1 Tax=Phoenix dactylifera TaxID=42345 RepID=A0A8B7C1Z9_PHODC|nr:uncharacterized protein LOC103707267 isoform X1 [Phoenix dactylifera]
MAGEWVERRGSLWKDRARELQLRIRDRFRVAVDRHRNWRVETDCSLTLRRWILLVRSVWRYPSAPARSSSSSSSRFYRKRVDKNVDEVDDSIIVRLFQALAVPVIGNACHVFMHGLNCVQIYGAEKLHQALLGRPEGKPLITVSNHVASVDDPLVIASLLPPSVMLDARNLRWTLCATDRCFTNPVLSAFFRCVKVLPVSRGEGIYQKGMDMALSKLNNGGWVHIFPEGSRSRDGGRTIGSAKRGVARLVMDADSTPMVVPFVHTGMQEIMPIGVHFPKIGKKVTVLIGDPIAFDDLVLDKDDAQHDSRGILYDAVSSRIGQRLQELKVLVDRLSLEQPLEVQEYYIHNSERGYGIWQQVDWEAFGMGNFMLSEEETKFVKRPSPEQTVQNVDQPQKLDLSPRTVRVGFSYEGGIVSRIRGFMNPTDLMGFAARGLFMNGRTLDESCLSVQEVGLKAWKHFLEGHIFQQWNSM